MVEQTTEEVMAILIDNLNALIKDKNNLTIGCIKKWHFMLKQDKMTAIVVLYSYSDNLQRQERLNVAMAYDEEPFMAPEECRSLS